MSSRLSQLTRLVPLATAEIYPAGVPIELTVRFHDGRQLVVPVSVAPAAVASGEEAADEPSERRPSRSGADLRVERREAVIGALRATDRPINRHEVAELSGLRDNSRLAMLLQTLIEVEKVVKRLPRDLYWLAERPLPEGTR